MGRMKFRPVWVLLLVQVYIYIFMHILRDFQSLEVYKKWMAVWCQTPVDSKISTLELQNSSFHTHHFTCALVRLLPDTDNQHISVTERADDGPGEGRHGNAPERTGGELSMPARRAHAGEGAHDGWLAAPAAQTTLNTEGFFSFLFFVFFCSRPSIIKPTDSISQPSTAVAWVQAGSVHVHGPGKTRMGNNRTAVIYLLIFYDELANIRWPVGRWAESRE